MGLLAPKLFHDWSVYFAADHIGLARPMVSFLKEKFKDKELVGCEVGTREGINALRMLKTLNIKKLFLVDPYLPYDEPLVPEASSVNYQLRIKVEAYRRLCGFDKRVVWVTKTSDAAACDVGDELDFCYLDGDHTGEQVARDIYQFGNKVKVGGVLGGHDFNLTYPGLCKAVLDASHQPCWGGLSGKFFDWWMIRQ